MTSDLELLRSYTRNNSEESFTALVNRHLGLVYSAALRQVRSAQLAEEVAQSAFVDLARQAHTLAPDTILTAWLYQVTRRTAINVVRHEARRQFRELAASELAAMNASANEWTQVEALLDEAMHALDEADRAAILLRYFENKSLREVGQALGASDNAAQKRISRAVERLREFFAKHGVAVGASGLAVAISGNAVQAAPAGLAATISAASALAGTALATSATTTTTTITKAIVMTTLQKTLVAATLVIVAGTGIFETYQASTLKTQVQNLQQQQAPLAAQIQQLQNERDDAVRQLTSVRADNERLNRNTPELLKLRDEVGGLRRDQATHETTATVPSPGITISAPQAPMQDGVGKELGQAVVRGDAGALDKLVELARSELMSFDTNRVGLDDTQRSELSRQTFAPLAAAFDVVQGAATAGNQVAVAAVVRSAQIPELQGGAINCIGAIAGTGDNAALEILLNPRQYNFPLSATVSALQPAADSGNGKAIAALAAVANDANQEGLWYMAASGLQKAAESGNSAAVDALTGLAASTNISVRNAIVPALKVAAANQNAKAAQALQAMGVE